MINHAVEMKAAREKERERERDPPRLHRPRLRSLCSTHNSLGGWLVAIVDALRGWGAIP